MSKTIFVSVFYPFISRNILNTGVLEELLKGGNRIVIFVQPQKEDFYKKSYSNPQISVESFDLERSTTKTDRFFRGFAELLLDTKVKKFHKMHVLHDTGNHFSYLFKRAITAIFGRSHLVKYFFRFLERKLNNLDAYAGYFDKYNPDVVFATDIYNDDDVLLIKSAKKRGVKVVGMVGSWDNNTSKHLMRAMPDELIVHNETIKEESVKLHAVPDNKITIVGIPHYDYCKKYVPVSREEFCTQMGLDSKKRFIVFSPAGEKFISTDWQICEILKSGYKEGKIPEDVVTIIRLHPTNVTDLSRFNPDSHFVIENPGIRFEGMGDKKKELDKAAYDHLLDTIHHSEIVINIFSSIVLDAAVIGKPVITIGFNGFDEEVPFVKSVKRWISEDHMEKLLKTGGAPVVRSPEELFSAIRTYLDKPSLDGDGRERIVSEQCWKLDGKSQERIAKVILEQ